MQTDSSLGVQTNKDQCRGVQFRIRGEKLTHGHIKFILLLREKADFAVLQQVYLYKSSN